MRCRVRPVAVAVSVGIAVGLLAGALTVEPGLAPGAVLLAAWALILYTDEP